MRSRHIHMQSLMALTLALALVVPGASAARSKSAPKGSTARATDITSGPVDLNTATQAQLEALPGIGPATAKKIIAGRPYASIDDLKRAGVPARTIESLRGSMTVSGMAAATPAGTPATPKRSSGLGWLLGGGKPAA